MLDKAKPREIEGPRLRCKTFVWQLRRARRSKT